MPDVQTSSAKYVFRDVVSITRNRSIEARSDIVATLNLIVHTSLAEVGLHEENVVFLPTGDGMCISILDVHSPYDIHVLVALAILKEVEQWNGKAPDAMRQFQIRVGVNANVDNVIIDINNRKNLAGSGINTAQRVMDSADPEQLIVGQAVYETLIQREKYLDKFRGYQARIKHDFSLPVFQFTGAGHAGLNIEVPVKFQIKKDEPKKLTKTAAYYIAHSLRLQPHFSFSNPTYSGADTWSILAWVLANDSMRESEKRPFETVTPYTWKAKTAGVKEQFAHYQETDWYVRSELGDFIEANFSDYANCFHHPSGGGVVIVNDEGKRKLREDFPDIWTEFGFDREAPGVS